jgi:hypothetical protein
MEEGLCFMVLGVWIFECRFIEYKFFELWYLSCDSGLGDFNLYANNSQYGSNCGDSIKLSKYCNHYLLYFNRNMVFRNFVFLYV